jgi:hypothetical protein
MNASQRHVPIIAFFVSNMHLMGVLTFNGIKGGRQDFRNRASQTDTLAKKVSQFQVIIECCWSQGDSFFVQYIKWN